MTRKLFIIIAILASFSLSTFAQRTRLSGEQLKQGLAEMRAYKHRLLIKELDLTKEQEQKFFDIYDKMDDELITTGLETRELERKTLENEKATDTECEAVARTLFEQKKKESDIELSYYDRLAEVLTPRQLLKLKSVERRIAMNLAKYHGRRAHGGKQK